ncbi:MAG: NADH-quinone oxidoreductase subunit J [Desulfobacula sp.]|jgi:NADH-quinone oxidoreductase subunit J
MITLYGLLFYTLSAIIIASTVLAVTQKNMVHAVLYLVVSFLGTGLLFFLLGAPLLAAFEVMIYAGAIMVLFLFIVMMLNVDTGPRKTGQSLYYIAALGTSGLYFIICAVLVHISNPEENQAMQMATASPAAFGLFLFQRHWLAIEIVSLLLLIALIGVMQLGVMQLGLGPKRRKPE